MTDLDILNAVADTDKPAPKMSGAARQASTLYWRWKMGKITARSAWAQAQAIMRQPGRIDTEASMWVARLGRESGLVQTFDN